MTDFELQIKSLKEFKGSKAWITNFMKRNGLHRSKGLGESGHADASGIAEAQNKTQKKLAIYMIYQTYPIQTKSQCFIGHFSAELIALHQNRLHTKELKIDSQQC